MLASWSAVRLQDAIPSARSAFNVTCFERYILVACGRWEKKGSRQSLSDGQGPKDHGLNITPKLESSPSGLLRLQHQNRFLIP